MEGFVGQGPLFIFSLIFVLGLVVVIHELGHYLAGRAFGAAAESFSVGFGRSLVEFTDKRNTRWRINWLPLGGFVKFVGEDPRDTGEGQADYKSAPIGRKYNDLSLGQRSIVAVAGPAANFILAIFIFSLTAIVFGKPVHKIVMMDIMEGPAKTAGLENGDILMSLNGRDIQAYGDFYRVVSTSSGTKLTLGIERDGEALSFNVTPERRKVDNGLGQEAYTGMIGVMIQLQQVDHIRYNLPGAVLAGVRETGAVCALTARMIGRMMTGKEDLSQLSGPVGIGDVTRRVVNKAMGADQVPLSDRLQVTFWMLLKISAFVSIGIGLFNLLPLPILDGGHLLMNGYEAVMGSALPLRIQETALKFSLFVLLSLAGLVTLNDIMKTGLLDIFGG